METWIRLADVKNLLPYFHFVSASMVGSGGCPVLFLDMQVACPQEIAYTSYKSDSQN